MVQFFKPQPKALPSQAVEITIDNLDHHLTGVGRYQGKACFVEGVLPGEKVRVQITEQKKQYAHGRLRQVLTPSAARLEPFCPAFHQCGGCNAQMMPQQVQCQAKQEGVQRLFRQLAKIELPAPLWIENSPPQAYRRVCRLAVKYEKSQRAVQVGFRQKQSQALVEIEGCPVLTPALSVLISPLRSMLNTLSSYRDIGHIELYDTESGLAMLVRHNGKPSTKDKEILLAFAQQHECVLYLQTTGYPEALTDVPPSFYVLDDQRFYFQPGDFLQVNAAVNQRLVQHVCDWLAPQTTDRVLDLFCGVGNFTLPLARHAASVTGIEGVDEMVQRATHNANQNQLVNTEFHRADLTKMAEYANAAWQQQCYDLILLDPGRTGAEEVMPWLAKSKARRIVYVSCNPVTAARDCALLQSGYTLKQWGLLDMFPHTGHVESLFLFEQK
jgi:23S rRNA (uracil-5-)-methyltransferase RumA